jgi:hypothetical protein
MMLDCKFMVCSMQVAAGHPQSDTRQHRGKEAVRDLSRSPANAGQTCLPAATRESLVPLPDSQKVLSFSRKKSQLRSIRSPRQTYSSNKSPVINLLER